MRLMLDVFSGRPNPSWQLPPTVVGKILGVIADNGLLSSPVLRPYPSNLGYRGLEIGLPVEIANKYRLPPFLNLPADIYRHLSVLKGLVGFPLVFPGFFGLEEFLKLVQMIIDLLEKAASPPAAAKSPTVATGPSAFEMLPYEPALWIDPAFQPTNKCYAYASNKRAKYPAKPQPGIGSGAMYSAYTGANVSAAAKRDGAHDVNDCFPDSEAPRLLVALVIWPGVDYHWYRKHPDFWGHKQGDWPARNTDDSHVVITNPETCNRGPYTEFYGYMLIPKSQKVAA
jgi:hypothetical protein